MTNIESIAHPSRFEIDPKLCESLVCPLTKGRLVYDSSNQELISVGAKLAYPIQDGIPILIVDSARVIDE